VALTGRDISPDIVIVAIDDSSIDALGRWPWRRAVHAALLDRLIYPTSISAPIPALAQAAAGSGFINANLDADGVLRSAVL
ncbi:CHASE2 domain-containing protein, partial [Achromobacter xylosoxidans]|nr:CHASE2 domain-containing protein [Achromobacter xylosoxidans]